MPPSTITTVGPGRVNLIGDHTDYNGGLALPMAIDLGVTAAFTFSGGEAIEVESDGFGHGTIPLDPVDGDGEEGPVWTRLIAALVALARPGTGGSLRVTTTLPVGAGLSSSAALCVALARAFGVEASPLAVARLCREAEHRVGAPVGLMDPWVSAGGRASHALLLDFGAETAAPVPIPVDADVVVVDSGRPRAVRSSGYQARVAECEAAAATIGPLGSATATDLAGLHDAVLRRRARHVVTECARVRATAQAFGRGDVTEAGRLMGESHRSLAEDFEVSTPELDELVADLTSRPGVLGARMTGAGFGGCVVALSRPGALELDRIAGPAWRVVPTDGAYADWGDGPHDR
jgi:galactokinase